MCRIQLEQYLKRSVYHCSSFQTWSLSASSTLPTVDLTTTSSLFSGESTGKHTYRIGEVGGGGGQGGREEEEEKEEGVGGTNILFTAKY